MKSFLFFCSVSIVCYSQQLSLPDRPASEPTGSQFYSIAAPLSRDAREDTIFAHVMKGDVPEFLRKLVPVTTTKTINGTSYTLEYYVIPEYFSIGTDSDYFRMPMTPALAQRIANALNCTLPTAKMVDQIYSAAPLKLRPQPIPPDAEMINVPRFYQHNDSVKALRIPQLQSYPLGTLVGGTKKDVIIDKKIYSWLKGTNTTPVVIYGWHQLNGVPIQPVYNGHVGFYADYSHGIRLVQRTAKINGADISLIDIMQDPVYYSLISDTALVKPYYGSLTDIQGESEVQPPKENDLYQNYPNPFNPTTTIRFRLAKEETVTMRLFDIIGEEVATLISGDLPPGSYEYTLSSDRFHLSSGVYFYTLMTPSYSETHHMVLLK